jgi:hypothetical protein
MPGGLEAERSKMSGWHPVRALCHPWWKEEEREGLREVQCADMGLSSQDWGY